MNGFVNLNKKVNSFFPNNMRKKFDKVNSCYCPENLKKTKKFCFYFIHANPTK